MLSTRPASTIGTSITPLQNSFSTYAEILSDTNVTKDCYGILINVNGGNVSTAAKDTLCTIGIDTAGGTSYVDLIPNLLVSCSWAYTAAPGGHWYYFPIYIPAGSAIAAKGSVNNAAPGTFRVAVWLFGAPADPASLRYGHGVEAIGITGASSSGTAVTAGGASEGSWTSLGTTTRPCFAWQYGMGCNDGTMTALLYHADLSYGDGTNQVMIGQDKVYYAGATEQLGCGVYGPNYCAVPGGSTIYGRLQCSGTADSALSMAAYGVY